MADQFFFKTAPGQPLFSEEVCTMAFEPTRPYPQNPYAILYRARFKQLRAYYTKPAPNTPHPNLPQVYFADDVDFQDKTAGLVEWTRLYCTAPTSWNDFASDTYTFPGLTGVRVPITKTVTQKIVQDYFLVGTLPTFQSNVAGGDTLSGWTTSNLNILTNSANVPACAGGANTASQYYADGTVGQHVISISSNAASGAIAAAVFMRSNGTNANKLRIALTDGAAAFGQADYDMANASTTLANGNSAQIIAIGDGWFRGTLQATATNANALFAIYLLSESGANVFAFSPNSTVGLWRPQLVQSGTIPHATVPPTVTPDATNYPIASADFVPMKFGLLYQYTWALNAAAEYLDGSTTPNINTYNAWVATDSNAANVNSYSIESTDSTLSLWQGSVWQRQRHYVKAR